MTVILISHSMDDVARLVERIIIMDQGELSTTVLLERCSPKSASYSRLAWNRPR